MRTTRFKKKQSRQKIIAKMLFDFECKNKHKQEHFADSDTKELICSVCGHTATRLISPVSTIFKGHGWPDKDIKWAKDHEKAAVQN